MLTVWPRVWGYILSRLSRFVFGMAVLLGLACTGACRSAPPTSATHLHTFEGMTMGTTYTVRTVTGRPWNLSERERIGTLIQSTLDEIEAKMSHYDTNSELSRFNRIQGAAPFTVSADPFEVVRLAQEISVLTGGALDITVGPLVNAWGFGPSEPVQLPPDPGQLARLEARVGYDQLTLDPVLLTLTKKTPGLECDLSAVAKGYGVDRVADVLAEVGVTRFMVEVGGEISAVGLNQQDRPWRIGIERPTAEGGIETVVPLRNHAMATSGDYRNTREIEGQLVSHTIDPRTGRPVDHQLASVSVISEHCAVADGLATALEVLGPEQGYALAVRQGWAALFLVRLDDGTVAARTTPAFDRIISES